MRSPSTAVTSRRPSAASSSWPDGEERPETSEIWDRLQAELPDQRERRLAYLLYHCGLQPSEIVRSCPQEWSDVHEVARLRRSILVRLMQMVNALKVRRELSVDRSCVEPSGQKKLR